MLYIYEIYQNIQNKNQNHDFNENEAKHQTNTKNKPRPGNSTFTPLQGTFATNGSRRDRRGLPRIVKGGMGM